MSSTVKPLDWEATIGQRVRIYRNLSNHRISVMTKIPKKGWRVSGHVLDLELADVAFIVNEAKRQYIIHCRKKRDVCAVAEGTLLGPGGSEAAEQCSVVVDFNPFKSAKFFEKETENSLQDTCTHLAVCDNIVFASSDALIQAGDTLQPELEIITNPQPWLLHWAIA